MLMFLCIAGASAGDVNDTTLKISTDTIEPTNLNGAATDNGKAINADNETIGVSSENNTKDNEIVNDVLMDSNSNNMNLMNDNINNNLSFEQSNNFNNLSQGQTDIYQISDTNLLINTPVILTPRVGIKITLTHFSQTRIEGSIEATSDVTGMSYGITGICVKESSNYNPYISINRARISGLQKIEKGTKSNFNETFNIAENSGIWTYEKPLYLGMFSLSTKGVVTYPVGYSLASLVGYDNPWTITDDPTISIDSANIGFGQQHYNISGRVEVASVNSGYGALLNLTTDDGVFLGSTMVNDDGTWTVSGIDSTLLTPGTYNLHADYAGNDNVGNVSNTTGVLNVNIGDFVPTISVGDINWCDNKTLTVTIKNGAGTAIKDLNVYFTGTGVSGTLSAMTNNDGVVSFNVADLPGEHILIGKFQQTESQDCIIL